MKKALLLSVMTLLLAACGSQQAEPKTATAESPKDANGESTRMDVWYSCYICDNIWKLDVQSHGIKCLFFGRDNDYDDNLLCSHLDFP